DLSGHRGVTLTLRNGAKQHGHYARGINTDPHMFGRTGLVASPGPFLSRSGQPDVAYVGRRRLHGECNSSPDELTTTPGFRLFSSQLFVLAGFENFGHGLLVVARIVDAAGRSSVGKGTARHKVALP